MIKINFKQPKYIFPLVIFVPLCALVYFVMQTFSGGKETAGTVATDRINMELPQANAEEAGDKMYEMSRRFGDEDAFTAVSGIGEEEQKKEELEHGYSEEELNRLDAAEAERQRQQRELEELERSLAESRKHINAYAYGNGPSGNSETGYGGMGYSSQDEFARDLEEIQRRSYERQKAIESGLGIKDPEAEEAERKHRADSIARVRQEERERNRPSLVIKSDDTNADRFNTVTAPDEFAENKLIRAMIDQTTKAHEGTRLRFKLLDDVTVSGTKLKKGTYLYGTVTGFMSFISSEISSAATPFLADAYTNGQSNCSSEAPRSMRSSRTSSITSSALASGRSILLIHTMTGSFNSIALRSTNLVCGIAPSNASTTRITPLTILRTRSTSPPKSACPGVSIILIFTPL